MIEGNWFGTPPEGWKVRPLGFFFRERKEVVSDRDFPPLSVTMSGIVPQLDTAAKTDNNDSRKLVRAGDFVINSRSDRKGSSGLSDRDGSVSVISTVLVPRAIEGRFAHHLLRSPLFQEEFYRWGSGIVADLWSTRYAAMKRIPLAVPPEPEQRAIADFLDRETTQIDAMVDAQERLVALLEERRRTFLTHAVLAATSAGARVDSGLTWLGPIPPTWELKPLKYLIDYMDQGWSPQCESYPVEGPDEWGVLKAGCVNGGVFRPQENKKLPEDLEPRPITTLRSGDIVISRANTRDLVGSAAVIEHDHPRLMLSDKLYRMRLLNSAMPGYVAMVLGADPYREQIELAAGGASHSMQNIARSDIVNLPVPVPPLEVQDRIVREVTDVEARTRSMISSAQKSIALMKERRAAVISAAVTGRIDVRTGIEQVERDLEEARV